MWSTCIHTEERAVGDDQLGVGREGAVDQVHDQLVCLLPTQRQAAADRRLPATPGLLVIRQGDRLQGQEAGSGHLRRTGCRERLLADRQVVAVEKLQVIIGVRSPRSLYLHVNQR